MGKSFRNSEECCSADCKISVNGRLGALFRARHPVKTAACVAAEIGVSERAVAGWLAGEASPGLGHVASIVAAYGPDAVAAFFKTPPEWLDAVRRRARVERLVAEQQRIASEIEALRD